MAADHAFMKLYFQNALNSIHRVKMLEATRDLTPDIYPFVLSSYSSPSHLQWGDRSILSAEGVQLGDPLGPLLFCLTLHRYCQCLSSVLYISYLEDVTVGGSCADILQNLLVVRKAESIGLHLNSCKCEIITQDNTTLGTILKSLPGALVVDHGCLLFPSQPLVYSLKVIPSGLPLDFTWAPCCAAPINANIVGRRWML